MSSGRMDWTSVHRADGAASRLRPQSVSESARSSASQPNLRTAGMTLDETHRFRSRHSVLRRSDRGGA
jgi:hypothetical protein